jgi:hypothetical protein
MKNKYYLSLLLITFVLFSAFGLHKFYVSIYQISYVPQKKRIQITARIFMDDLNSVLETKFNKSTHIGGVNETIEEVELMRKYLIENLIIKINNQPKQIQYISKEIESNVVICYFKIQDIAKIKSFEIQNKALFELSEDQQNIIQLNIFNKKQNLLLTPNNVKALLNQQ